MRVGRQIGAVGPPGNFLQERFVKPCADHRALITQHIGAIGNRVGGVGIADADGVDADAVDPGFLHALQPFLVAGRGIVAIGQQEQRRPTAVGDIGSRHGKTQRRADARAGRERRIRPGHERRQLVCLDAPQAMAEMIVVLCQRK